MCHNFFIIFLFFSSFLYYLIYSSCVIIHLIVLGCFLWLGSIRFHIFILFSKNQGPRPCIWSQTLVNKVPDLVLSIFFKYHFFLTLLSAYLSNASIMHTIVFLIILKPHLMKFCFHYLRYHRRGPWIRCPRP